MTERPLDDRHDAEAIDRIHDALSSERNRLVISYFREHDADLASLSDLAGYVAGRGSRNDDPSTHRIAVALHHWGLPKLTDAGVLEYDLRSETARRRDHLVYDVGALGDLIAVA